MGLIRLGQKTVIGEIESKPTRLPPTWRYIDTTNDDEYIADAQGVVQRIGGITYDTSFGRNVASSIMSESLKYHYIDDDNVAVSGTGLACVSFKATDFLNSVLEFSELTNTTTDTVFTKYTINIGGDINNLSATVTNTGVKNVDVIYDSVSGDITICVGTTSDSYSASNYGALILDKVTSINVYAIEPVVTMFFTATTPTGVLI